MSDTIKRINELKKEKNAVIFAHYYCPEETQAVADNIGDSFYLARAAKETDADIIVFAGVRFMGESAKILNPGKTVLMPDMKADCPMAHMASAERIAEVRREHPGIAVVCYVNSTAELKCASDVCVTSSNAEKIVRALPNREIYFIPDRNLGRHVAKAVPEKTFVFNDGYCPIHHGFSEEELIRLREEHPRAEVMAHPESRECILKHAGYIGSTAGIIDRVEHSDADEFIIFTEKGINYALKNAAPEKKFFYPGCGCECADMKLNTPEAILHVLETGENEVILEPGTAERALAPLERMLELGK